MPQVLKDEVRARILDAARAVFAEQGFVGATMAAIAARAEVGAASLYRYFPSKEGLFDAAIPPAVARDFEALLDRRVRALGASLARSKDDAGDEMLRFWAAHRLAVVVLLDRAAGTAHAGFGAGFVERLVALSVEQLRAVHPGAGIDAPTRFVLRRIFEGTRATLAAILEAHEDPRAMRDAVEVFWSYQLAGLRAVARRVGARRGRRPGHAVREGGRSRARANHR
jgi:AcrR family transcriptional regulator